MLATCPAAGWSKRDATTRLDGRGSTAANRFFARRQGAYPLPHAGALRLSTELLTATSLAGFTLLFSFVAATTTRPHWFAPSAS